MRTVWIWLWLLTKRLYKKPVFVTLLLLIPILVLGYTQVSGEESGIVTVVLAAEAEDPLAVQTMEELEKSSALIRFLRADPEEAEAMVRWGKADAAWIFPAQMQQQVERYVEDPGVRNAIVRVLQREESVSARMAREKLGSTLFACCSRSLYLEYAYQNGLEHLSEAELMAFYHAASPGDNLFAFSDVQGDTVQVTYLTAPIRGLLAVVIVLGALATAMYELRDRELGTFGWVSEGKRPWLELGCQMISLCNLCPMVLICLLLAGLCGSLLYDLAVLFLFAVCAAVFAMLLRRLCGNEKALGVLLPVLTTAMIGICPVFFDFSTLRYVQLLLPPTYYIQALGNSGYLLLMAAYTLCCAAGYYLLGKWKHSVG